MVSKSICLDRWNYACITTDSICCTNRIQIMIVEDKITRLITTSDDLGPIVLHRGILFKHNEQQFILHQTFSGPEVTPLYRFAKKRKILNRKVYKLSKPLLIEEELMNPNFQRFNVLVRNCENFTNHIIRKYTSSYAPPFSQQVAFWIILVALMAHLQTKI